jgi:hypothetical protein
MRSSLIDFKSSTNAVHSKKYITADQRRFAVQVRALPGRDARLLLRHAELDFPC